MNCLRNLATFVWIFLYQIQGSFALEFPPNIQSPPRITQQPLEAYYLQLKSGKDKTIPCEAQANPSVKEYGSYFWKKDGEIVASTQGRSDVGLYGLAMTGPHGALTFRVFPNSSTSNHPGLAYQGRYQCFAKNRLGTALSNVAIVKIATELTSSVEDDNVTLQEGDSLTKPCVDLKYRNSDEEELEWKFSREISQKSNRIAQAPDRSIIFSNVVAEDSGLSFYCSSKDVPTRTTIESPHYTLLVQNASANASAPYHPPEIVFPKAKDKIIALKDEVLSLACIATGNPSPSTQWNSQNQFELDDFNRTLRIASVKYSDSGIYTCIAENKVSLRKRDVKVIVESKPYFTNESMKPTDIVAEPGQKVKITCEIRGRPTPTITWMKNGEILPSQHNESLHLRQLTEDDTAVYQCIGENKHGIIMGQGFVNVLAIPPKPWPDFSPVIRMLEGSVLILRCAMFSVTQKYDAWWTRDNQPQANLLRDNRIHKEKDYRLVTKNINVDDSDIYRCNASNKYGSTIISINVTVLFKTAFINAKKQYFVKAGDSVTMSVQLEQDPQMRGVRVYWRTKNAVTKSVGTTLTISDAKASDGGEYVVEVTAELGQDVTIINLIVQDFPECPLDVTFMKDQHNNYTGTLLWSRPINIHNSPIKAYYIDVLASTRLFKSAWKPLGKTSRGVKTFSITALRPWVRYSFRVWAENGIGKSLQPSEPTEIYLTPPRVPTVNPTGVQGKGTSPKTIVVRWRSVDFLDHAGPGFGYDVSWRLAGGDIWKKEFVGLEKPTMYTITDTQAFTKYEIKVQSSNNEGPAPEPKSIMTFSDEDVPEAPESFEVVKQMFNEIGLKWSEPTKVNGKILGYKLQCQWKENGKIISRNSSWKKSSTRIVGLTPNTSYLFSLCAETAAGVGTNCSKVTARTVAPRKPEIPSVSVTTNQGSFDVRWNSSIKDQEDGIPVDGYVVQHRKKEKIPENWTSSEFIPASRLGKYLYTLTKLAPNTQYELRVLVTNHYGNGASISTDVRTSKKGWISTGRVGSQIWFIIVLCVVALVVLVIAIACFIRRRRGGTYPVSEKEEQLVVQYETQPDPNPDYGKYSAATALGIDNRTADVDEERREAGTRLRGDSVSGNSIEAFGTGTTRDYDEDGSFIDQYGLDQHSESKSSSPGTIYSDSLAFEQSQLVTDHKQEAV